MSVLDIHSFQSFADFGLGLVSCIHFGKMWANMQLRLHHSALQKWPFSESLLTKEINCSLIDSSDFAM